MIKRRENLKIDGVISTIEIHQLKRRGKPIFTFTKTTMIT